MQLRALALWVVGFSAFSLSCSDDPDSGASSGGASSSGRTTSSSGAPASSSGSSSGEVVGSGDSPNELCWSTINEYRKKQGLTPYERWTDAESCADGEAKSDAQTNKPHGAFPRCEEMAQNECPGTPGSPEKAIPACLALMWAEGPGGGHHDAMASTKYKKVACGVFVTADGKMWSVQNFR